ncbi:galactosyltransferase Lgt5 [Moraxella bovis]|uniref:glycosyltransferase n=1 Tax=Moraxella bovis TaxID=476 RepID=UPI002225D64D|nr:glycosyltransferase [Moraxella bovis]UYZ69594.1 galactosyltransferase Lgt5 [Moraxella bovis]UYZ71966.1 galactosyltransferase Lgt5 [Moraxella bovis]UYZ72124.1 galactosyltransferase Lgt5 [Moraxella bovis]UZA15266.1 galactosyltransferase Lgt5 [Moraxella bovis]UZA26379.1 galactosyltransferase Lgt5 [Moraxella bovis]
MLNTILPTIHALWIGSNLGQLSHCCLSSFVAQGHQVYLHTYNDINDLPKGVQLADANLIIPKNKIIKHKKTGSYALFSDIFRYELLNKVDGIYVDCDVYCTKPITIPDNGYLFGYEDDNKINGAVLALPKNSLLLNKLIEISHDSNFIPPWYSNKAQKRLKIKKMFGIAKHISHMPWGVIGPEAITYYAKEFNLGYLAQPIDIFYPVHYHCIRLLLEKDLTLSDICTKRTLAVHLYNEMLKNINLNQIEKTSVLSKMLREEI